MKKIESYTIPKVIVTEAKAIHDIGYVLYDSCTSPELKVAEAEKLHDIRWVLECLPFTNHPMDLRESETI